MRNLNLILISAFLAGLTFSAHAVELPRWLPFNKQNALKDWQEKVFKNRVLYAVEVDKTTPEGMSLEAESKEACSGLIYRISFSAQKYPMMSWEWKVTKFPSKSANVDEGGWIEKDDYAARVYIIFPSIVFTDIKSIEYVWDENLPAGTVMTSPYFENIKLIVLESGRKNLGQWVHEERNIAEDYKKAFGKPVTKRVGAISLMTDSDNTMSTAEAFYKNIKVGYKNE